VVLFWAAQKEKRPSSVFIREVSLPEKGWLRKKRGGEAYLLGGRSSRSNSPARGKLSLRKKGVEFAEEEKEVLPEERGETSVAAEKGGDLSGKERRAVYG